MGVTKKPDLNDHILRAKVAKGMGHNYYSEPAWPNDLLYIFLVVILGTIACNVGLAILEPSMVGEPADPFATPLKILPEWYFFLGSTHELSSNRSFTIRSTYTVMVFN